MADINQITIQFGFLNFNCVFPRKRSNVVLSAVFFLFVSILNLINIPVYADEEAIEEMVQEDIAQEDIVQEDVLVEEETGVDIDNPDELTFEESEDEGDDVKKVKPKNNEFYEKLYGKKLTGVPFSMKYAYQKEFNVEWKDANYDDRIDYIRAWELDEIQRQKIQDQFDRNFEQAKQEKDRQKELKKQAEQLKLQEKLRAREDVERREELKRNELKRKSEDQKRRLEQLRQESENKRKKK